MVQTNAPNPLDTVWLNARLATLAPAQPGLGIMEFGAIAAREGRIAFVGPQAELPTAWRNGARVVDCEGRWITPALIDCHTHLVYGGNRARIRTQARGPTYEQIARQGGGILSPSRDPRGERRRTHPIGGQAFGCSYRRGRRNGGIKSGYGLTLRPSANRSALHAGSPNNAT